jgi:murein DD-endopeptidase MepM/ murein hydrolase activator NlpD
MRKLSMLAVLMAMMVAALFGSATAAAASVGDKEDNFIQGREFYHPTSGVVTSRYNWRCSSGSDNHDGVDIANNQGTRIRAARGGDVVHRGWMSGYGYTIILQHASGYRTLYAHLSSFASFGGHANTNELIGYMGQSGNATGPHLHFEIRRNNVPLNINGSYNCGEHVSTFTYLRQSFPDLNPI